MEESTNKPDNQPKNILNDLIDHSKDSEEKSALIKEVCQTRHPAKPATPSNSSIHSSAASDPSTSQKLSSPSQSNQSNNEPSNTRLTNPRNDSDNIEVPKMEELGKTARIIEHKPAISSELKSILNLVLILLIISNARVALENIIKYGILVDPISWFMFLSQGSKHWPALLIIANQASHILVALLAEKLVAKKGTRKAEVAILINLVACISLPPLVIYLNDTHPISTSGSLIIVSIVFLKLVSYHMVNFWCRDMRCKGKQSRTTKAFLRSSPSLDSLSIYPENLNLADICFYMLYPTLCYELSYPRTERIRKRFLIKRTIELLILLNLVMALIQQWIVPTVSNSVMPFRQMQYGHMLVRLLKLAVPNHVIWLIWFYLFFHSLLNIVAELTRFADREFYRDWWNSESVYYFWANWNIPVHRWCARHLYIPMMSLGFNKCQASTAVFLVSAFFHEYLVSVPLKMFRIWAFTAMLIQLPMARFVSAYFNKQFANIAVWVSLIIGQPLCILMYYHDYYVINKNNNVES